MATWTDVVEIAEALPDVEESTSYRTPALKVSGRLMSRLRAESDGGLMVICGLDEKQALLAEGGPFYTTDHYDGHGSILVHLDQIDRGRLTELLDEAWQLRAPASAKKKRP
ncbi:MAG: hypothetical protein GX542_06830 [Rhodococcus sp.]|nr:hypothetical protein [Rhodococcus sp. (in: high G+C Gram-positive bacteria)]